MNIVHTIFPNPATTSATQSVGQSAHHAANYDTHAYTSVELAELVAKAQSATDEQATILQLVAMIDDWKIALKQRDDQLDPMVKVEKRKVIEEFAKQNGYLSADAMFAEHYQPAKSYDADTTRPLNIPNSKSNKAPKVYKWLLRPDAANVTADDEPGYIRLPKEQQGSDKYEKATQAQVCKMGKALADWESNRPKP